jgi:DNA-binding MarR family transcriptional regulator
MSLVAFNENMIFLENMVKRKRIIKELYPDKEYQQSELAKTTGISKGNISTYIRELEQNGIVIIESGINDRGQPVRIIRLSRKSLDTLKASSKIIHTNKPIFEDLQSLSIFQNGLFDADLQEDSLDSIQMLSIQYLIPVDSGFFTFLRDNLMKKELERTRRVLIKSTGNMVKEMSEQDKQQVYEIIEPVLSSFLKDSPSGLTREIKFLLNELGYYDKSYTELETLYISEISNLKVPEFIRTLILRDHHDKVPRLRSKLMGLHRESDDPPRI